MPFGSLWLPVIVSAVAVFVASSLVWTVLKHHAGDFVKLPDENALLEAMRQQSAVGPGMYRFPYCDDMKEMATPDMTAKLEQGPVGTIVLYPPGPMAIGKRMVQSLVFYFVVSFAVAYITRQALAPGDDFMTVFRFVGSTAAAAYTLAIVPDAIWWGRSWSSTIKCLLDGLAYGLITGAIFGWLWPAG